jgi:hypothetical protein
MKNIFFTTIVIILTATFTSCAPTEECVCDDKTITESDAKDSNVTLEEACTLAKYSNSSCKIQ